MAQIRKKLKDGEYSNITEMTADFYLMFDNARKAFPPNHKAYKDAEKMRKLLNEKLVDIENAESDEEDEDDDDEDGDEDEEDEDSDDEEEVEDIEEEGSGVEEDDNTVETQSTDKGKKRGRPKGSLNVATLAAKGIIKGPIEKMSLKKKLTILHNSLKSVQIGSELIIGNFIEKPSKKLYPDYYMVIQTPIDMQMIESRIKEDKYTSVEEAITDYKLMFSNCKQYNEEGSKIYNDATTLERHLMEKVKELTLTDKKPAVPRT